MRSFLGSPWEPVRRGSRGALGALPAPLPARRFCWASVLGVLWVAKLRPQGGKAVECECLGLASQAQVLGAAQPRLLTTMNK
eukprot:7420634-Alexandrium_andersonii.AAC.1